MQKLIQRFTYYYLISLFGITMMAGYSRFQRLLKKGRLREAHSLRQNFARQLITRGGYRLEIIKGDTDYIGQTCIICSNHASYLDIPVLCAAIEGYFGFLGKAELKDFPFLSIFFKTLDIPVQREDNARSMVAFKRSFQALRQGRSLVIFPEGGIINNPKIINPLKAGAFLLAIKLDIPLLVVGLPDNYKLMDADRHTAKTGKIRVILHKLIYPEGYTAEEMAEKVQTILQEDVSKYID